MAWTAHKNEADVEEKFDAADALEVKLDQLAQMIRQAKHFIVFTGAGISTSSGIPDFRGPQGVWTLAAKGENRTLPTTSPIKALPTVAHMALVKLQKEGILKYLITQNCDAIHRRSGIKQQQISELHGNGNTEECETCGKQYFRDFPTYRMYRGHDHFTGRFCTAQGCGGRLLEWTIDFGQNLPEVPLNKGFENARKADLCVVLGSSLTVSPACTMPKMTKKCGGKLVIVNLQNTPLDDRADIKINGSIDTVMTGVMKRLGLSIPTWKLRRRIAIGHDLNKETGETKILVQGLDVDDESLSASIFKKVNLESASSGVSSTTIAAEPFLFTSEKLVAGAAHSVTVNLHFMKHYGEPKLTINYKLDTSVMASGYTLYSLSYHPAKNPAWTVRTGETRQGRAAIAKLPLPDEPLAQIKKLQDIPDKCHLSRLWASATMCTTSAGVQIGVISGGAGKTSTPPLLFFTPSTRKWKSVGGITTDETEEAFTSKARWAHASCAIGNKAYLIGGWDSQSQYNDVHVVNVETEAIAPLDTTGPRPSHRGGMSATAIGKLIYVFGGANCSGGTYQYFNDIYTLNTQTNVWSGPLKCSGVAPPMVAQHSAVAFPELNSIVVLGGCNGTGISNEIFILNVDSLKWSKLSGVQGNGPFAVGLQEVKYRVYPASFIACRMGTSNKIFVYGMCKQVETMIPCTYLLDMSTKTWSRLGDQLTKDFPVLTGPCCLNYSNGSNLLVFGGLRDGSQTYNPDSHLIQLRSY